MWPCWICQRFNEASESTVQLQPLQTRTAITKKQWLGQPLSTCTATTPLQEWPLAFSAHNCHNGNDRARSFFFTILFFCLLNISIDYAYVTRMTIPTTTIMMAFNCHNDDDRDSSATSFLFCFNSFLYNSTNIDLPIDNRLPQQWQYPLPLPPQHSTSTTWWRQQGLETCLLLER